MKFGLPSRRSDTVKQWNEQLRVKIKEQENGARAKNEKNKTNKHTEFWFSFSSTMKEE